jgi:Ethanolamine utilization protein EutJ (predicted chaperonin)
VSSVVLLAQHLEACNLQDFWAATGSCKDTISKGVCCVIGQPWSSIVTSVLHVLHMEACNVQDLWAATGSCTDTISKGVS